MAEAMTWLGTPYLHRQRLKGVAVDCAGLPLEVYEACGIIPHTDVGEYTAQWHLHHSEEIYLAWVEKFGRAIDPAAVGPGDFVVVRWGRTYSHGGIVLGPREVIHAFADARRVTIDDWAAHERLRGRPTKAFTFWGA